MPTYHSSNNVHSTPFSPLLSKHAGCGNHSKPTLFILFAILPFVRGGGLRFAWTAYAIRLRRSCDFTKSHIPFKKGDKRRYTSFLTAPVLRPTRVLHLLFTSSPIGPYTVNWPLTFYLGNLDPRMVSNAFRRREGLW